MFQFGQACERQALEVSFMIYEHAGDLPQPPEGAIVSLGCKDDVGPYAVSWIEKGAPWIALHRRKERTEAGEKYLATLKWVMAPYWFSTLYPLPCPDDSRKVA